MDDAKNNSTIEAIEGHTMAMFIVYPFDTHFHSLATTAAAAFSQNYFFTNPKFYAILAACERMMGKLEDEYEMASV